MIHREFECDFYLIRHGQSESNAIPSHLFSNEYDSNLTPRGEEQARRLGERLAAERVTFDRVYSSSYRRAVQTARIMAEAMGTPDIPIPAVFDLREHVAPDDWRGKRMDEIFPPAVVAYRDAKGHDFKAPGGESTREVERRVSAWLENEFIFNSELVSQPVSMTVAIVGHGTAMQCLMRHILGFDQRMIWRLGLDNCSISRFRFDSGGWSLISINDAVHTAELRTD